MNRRILLATLTVMLLSVAADAESRLPSQIPSLLVYWDSYISSVNAKLDQLATNFSAKVSADGTQKVFFTASSQNPYGCSKTEFLTVLASMRYLGDGSILESRQIRDCSGKRLYSESATIRGKNLKPKSVEKILNDGPTRMIKADAANGVVHLDYTVIINDNQAEPLRLTYEVDPQAQSETARISIASTDLVTMERSWNGSAENIRFVRFRLPGSLYVSYGPNGGCVWKAQYSKLPIEEYSANLSASAAGSTTYSILSSGPTPYMSLKDFLASLKTHLDTHVSIPSSLIRWYFLDNLPKSEFLQSLGAGKDLIFKNELQRLMSLLTTGTTTDVQQAKVLLENWNAAIIQGKITIEDNRSQ